MTGMDAKYGGMGYQQAMGYGISPDMYGKIGSGYAYASTMSPGYHPVMYSNFPMGMAGGAPSPTGGARGHIPVTMTSPNGTPVMTDSNGNSYRTSEYVNGKSYYNESSGQYSPAHSSSSPQIQMQQARYSSPVDTRHLTPTSSDDCLTKQTRNEDTTQTTYTSDNNSTNHHWSTPPTQATDISRPVAYVPVLL